LVDGEQKGTRIDNYEQVLQSYATMSEIKVQPMGLLRGFERLNGRIAVTVLASSGRITDVADSDFSRRKKSGMLFSRQTTRLVR